MAGMRICIVLVFCLFLCAVNVMNCSLALARDVDEPRRLFDDPMNTKSIYEKYSEEPGPISEKKIWGKAEEGLVKNELPKDESPAKDSAD
jgi:hypothetical protein